MLRNRVSRSSRAICVIVMFLLTTYWSVSLDAQTLPTAQQVLSNSLTAMGGQIHWSQVSDATLSGTCAIYTDQTDTQSAPFQWTVEQNMFRYQYGLPGQITATVSGNGSPAVYNASGTQWLTQETAALMLPYHLPGLVVYALLNDPSYQASIVGNDNLQGESTIHLHAYRIIANAHEAGSEQDWWFDSSSYLPVQVIYNTPGQGVQSYIQITDSLSSWSVDNGNLIIPHQINQVMLGMLNLQNCTATSLSINIQPQSSIFNAL